MSAQEEESEATDDVTTEVRRLIGVIAVSQTSNYEEFLQEIKDEYFQDVEESLDDVIRKQINAANFEDIKVIMKSLDDAHKVTLGQSEDEGKKKLTEKDLAIRFALALILHRYYIKIANLFEKREIPEDEDFQYEISDSEDALFNDYERSGFFKSIIGTNPFKRPLFGKRIAIQTKKEQEEVGQNIIDVLKDFVDDARGIFSEDEQKKLLEKYSSSNEIRATPDQETLRKILVILDITQDELYDKLMELIDDCINKIGTEEIIDEKKRAELDEQCHYSKIELYFLDKEDDASTDINDAGSESSFKVDPNEQSTDLSQSPSASESTAIKQARENQELQATIRALGLKIRELQARDPASEEQVSGDTSLVSQTGNDNTFIETADLDNPSQGTIDQLSEENEAKDARLNVLETKVAEQEVDITGLRAQLAERETEIRVLRNKLEEPPTENESQEPTELQKRIAKLEAENQQLRDTQREFDELRATNGALEERADKLQQENETLREKQSTANTISTSTPWKSRVSPRKPGRKQGAEKAQELEKARQKPEFKKWLKKEVFKIIPQGGKYNLDGQLYSRLKISKYEDIYKHHYGIEDEGQKESSISPIKQTGKERPVSKSVSFAEYDSGQPDSNLDLSSSSDSTSHNALSADVVGITDTPELLGSDQSIDISIPNLGDPVPKFPLGTWTITRNHGSDTILIETSSDSKGVYRM